MTQFSGSVTCRRARGCSAPSSTTRGRSGCGGSPTIPVPPASRRPPADGQLPRGADPGAGRGVRQPVPHRKRRGEFTAEDEELTVALAAAAAVAVENARLYEAAQTRGEWLQAVAAITRQVLAAHANDATGHFSSSPRRARGRRTPTWPQSSFRRTTANFGSRSPSAPSPAGVRDDPADDRIAVRTGLHHRGAGTSVAVGSGDGGHRDRRGVRLGAVVAVPLLGSTRVRGVLWAGRRPGQPAFGSEELSWPPGSPTKPPWPPS